MLPLILPMILVSICALIAVALGEKKHVRKVALGATLLNVIVAFYFLASAIASGSANFSEQYPISYLGITVSFSLSIISIALLLMSSVVLFATALSGNTERENYRLSGALILLFQIAAIGLFTSSNLLLFFVFWDIGVVALFFMINILGSASRKIASMNFLVYEIFASSLLLIGILLIYFYTPVHSFDIQYIIANASMIPLSVQSAIFAILFVAFMVNMPLFPMHFWLPDAHTEASTQGSMLLSGVLTKFGGFGMIILFSMLPVASKYSPYIAIIAGISVFYSVFVLMRQKDLKRIIAYSTIVEMGIIMLGISTLNNFGTYGAAYAMLAHGFAIALMFLVVGSLKHIFGERSIDALKGTAVNGPTTTYTFLLGTLAMIGFPLTAGFVADILLFIGSIQAFGILGVIPIFGLLIMGGYMYYIISKCMFSTREYSQSVDFIGIEQEIGYAIFTFFIFFYGLLPFALLNLVKL